MIGGRREGEEKRRGPEGPPPLPAHWAPPKVAQLHAGLNTRPPARSCQALTVRSPGEAEAAASVAASVPGDVGGAGSLPRAAGGEGGKHKVQQVDGCVCGGSDEGGGRAGANGCRGPPA